MNEDIRFCRCYWSCCCKTTYLNKYDAIVIFGIRLNFLLGRVFLSLIYTIKKDITTVKSSTQSDRESISRIEKEEETTVLVQTHAGFSYNLLVIVVTVVCFVSCSFVGRKIILILVVWIRNLFSLNLGCIAVYNRLLPFLYFLL